MALDEEKHVANFVNPVFTHQIACKTSLSDPYSLTSTPVKFHVFPCIHSHKVC